MRRILPMGIAVFTLAIFPSSCGSKTDGGESGATLSPGELPALLAQSFCKALANCNGALADLFLGGQSCEGVLGRQIAEGELAELQVAIDRGTVVYDAGHARACADALAALSCDIENGEPEACKQAVAGQVTPGGDCLLDMECEGDAFCRVEASCPGQCTAQLVAGASCSSNSECGTGLDCQAGTCAAPSGEGQSCGGSTQLDCGMGLFCDGADDAQGTPGTCVQAGDKFSAGAGDACGWDAKLCQAGLSCVYTAFTGTGATASCVSSVGSGAACGFGIPDQCPSGEYCDGLELSQAAIDLEGTCKPKPGAGQRCAQSPLGDVCAASMVCVSGICKEFQGRGGSCSTGSECYSQVCEAGACVRDIPCP